MNATSRRRDFKLHIHERDGQSFEDFFIKIMQYANVNFLPIKPHGSDGDRKNDGYDPTKGIYFQVYAPEDIRKSPYNAIKKLREDFCGLQSYWDRYTPINEFYFVINDKYKGAFPKINNTMAEIKAEFNLSKCELFLAQHLEAALFGLSEDIIEATLGSSGTSELKGLGAVIKHEKSLSSEGFFTSDNHIVALVYEMIQEAQGRVATPSDLLVYSPIIVKYGMEKGSKIVERSLMYSQK